MNVAYLDPPYSRYFHELSKRLVTPSNGNVVALLSSPAYRIYTRGDRSIVWQPGRVEAQHEVPEAFAKAEWARTEDADFVAAFSHAVEWFKERFRAERIDTCLVFSDARPFSQAAHIAAREVGVVCVFFERGAFRLRTSSVSAVGINARFDLQAATGFQSIVGMTEHDLPPRRSVERWLRSRFVTFLGLNAIARAGCSTRALMQHKRYHPFNYVRIALKQFLAEHPDLPAHHAPEPPGEGPVVLMPLQLPTDSQFVMYSPFKHNQEFIDCVVAGVRKVAPQARVLVKVHPMDVRRYRMPPGAQLIDGSLGRFYERGAVIVCLNSNAGFEAGIRGKRVLCFAESFYTRSNNAAHIVKSDRGDFAERLKELMDADDDVAAGKLLEQSLLRFYQAPGDAWAYKAEDIQVSARIVREHVNEHRRAPTATAERLPAGRPSAVDTEHKAAARRALAVKS